VRLPYQLNRSMEGPPGSGTERFVAVRGSSGRLDRARLRQPGRSSAVWIWLMAVHGTRVLTRAESAYVIRDLVSGSERAVTRDMPEGANGPPYQTERFAWIPPFLIDLERERVVGTTDALVVAVSRSGQVLHFPAGQPKPESRALYTGPLAWSGEKTP
jgi:hypothetical protein